MKQLFQTIVLFAFCHYSIGAKVIVTSINDSGAGSLRDAIEQTNLNTGADTILLSPIISGSTITLLSAMEDITDDSTYILFDINLDGEPNLAIDGSSLSSGEPGIVVLGQNVHINGIAIMGFPGNGIRFNASKNSSLTSSYIGLDLTGAVANGNSSPGVYIDGSDSVAIGLNNFGNVISGNASDGIYINNSDYVSISGNIIGLSSSGTVPLSNGGNGIYLTGSDSILIGNSIAGGRNIISSNTVCGILGNSGTFVSISNNYIGTDINGSLDLGNSVAGITTFASTNYWLIGNTITSGNVVSGNNQFGIDIQGSYHVIANNTIGLDVTQSTVLSNGNTALKISASQNIIRENVISGSISEGILITGSGAVNNLLRSNSIYNNNIGISLANNSQNNVLPPSILSIDTDSIVYGTASPISLVQIFADAGHEGQMFIDSVYSDISGNWSYQLSSADLTNAGNLSLDSLTAIQDDFGNSSAFSNPYPIEVPQAPVSIDHDALLDVKCYPNPTINDLFIESNSNEQIAWSVSDIIGNKIASGTFINSTKISFNNYISGIYIVELDHNHQHKIFKIVKD